MANIVVKSTPRRNIAQPRALTRTDARANCHSAVIAVIIARTMHSLDRRKRRWKVRSVKSHGKKYVHIVRKGMKSDQAQPCSRPNSRDAVRSDSKGSLQLEYLTPLWHPPSSRRRRGLNVARSLRRKLRAKFHSAIRVRFSDSRLWAAITFSRAAERERERNI